MASEKISQLPLIGSSSGGDLYPLVQTGNNYAITFTNLQSSIMTGLLPSMLPTITLTGGAFGAGAGGTINTTLINATATVPGAVTTTFVDSTAIIMALIFG